MSYKHKTPHLGIPVVGHRDRIMPDVEMRKYTIIENMLIAGTQGLTEVVFDDGSYSLEEDGGEYAVSVKAGGTYPSMHGIVGGFYFKAASKVCWSGLRPDHAYYLYVKATPSTPHDHSSVRLAASTVLLGKGSLLMAYVDLREEVPEVDTRPDGKVYSADVARHASDSVNPHGVRMEQDELVVTRDLAIGAGAAVSVGDESFQGAEFAAALNVLMGRRVEVVDFESGGEKGVLLKAGSTVRFAQAQERGAPGRDGPAAGGIGVGYYGDDETVDSESEFKVYNHGAEGLPMRALVICG